MPTIAFVLGQGYDASAIPLSSKPVGPGVHYFGYVSSAYQDCCAPVEGCPSGDYTACVADHANITHVAGKTPAETARLLEEARQLGMGAVVDASHAFFYDGASAYPKTTQDWTPAWNELKAAVAPYAGMIISFYLVDEPPMSAEMVAFLSAEANQIKAAFPDAHRQIIFSAATLDVQARTIPDGVDWVGYDCYPGTFKECYPLPMVRASYRALGLHLTTNGRPKAGTPGPSGGQGGAPSS